MSYTLAGEDPDLTDAITRLKELCELDGIVIDTADFGGVRTEADTVKIMKYRDDDYAVYVKRLAEKQPDAVPAVKEKWRPIAPFGSSFHNWGCARDFKVLKKPEAFTDAEAFRRMGSHAPKCGLRWGGNFKNRVDPPHVELAITLEDARKRWKQRQPLPSKNGPETD